ncbi:MAG: hypothetical protein U5P41_03670 [Gammaproteobacteria bacterium]|nr:hypothetical protein [Gammaproteobacteria bacterium]
MGCHSAKYMRYNRLGKDLGITDRSAGTEPHVRH